MEKDSILYSPSLKHSENFYTEGSAKPKATNDAEKEQVLDKEKKLISLYDNIKMKSLFLSSEIIDAYFSPLITMKSEFESIINGLNKKDEDKEEEKKEPPIDPEPEIPVDPEPETKEPDDIFDKEEDYYVDIVDPEDDYEVNIEDGYNNNFIEIYEDYLIKIESILDKFVFEILEINSNNDINFELSKMNSIEVKNPNLIHLTDFIIKSNIYIQQGIRLHKKIFNIDESIFHIKAPKVAKEQMLRYYKATYCEVKNNVDIKNNLLLKESRFIAERKYNDNTRDLYKYLNSQVILLRDTLSNVTKQLFSLSKLSNEKEGGE